MAIVCVHNYCEGFLTKPQGSWLCDRHRAGEDCAIADNEAPDRYTKGLEDMLHRIIELGFIDVDFIPEAKALLERTT